MDAAAVIGPCLLAALAAASLCWPGGNGPGSLLPPERLCAVVPSVWLACCVVLAGRAGAWRGFALALPALVAASCLAPDGLWSLPGVLFAALAGTWWWHAQPIAASDAAASTRLLIAAAFLAGPGLIGALWHTVGATPPLPPALTPIGAGAPAVWALVPLALAAGAIWWRSRRSEAPA